jgi:hypothetical protein
MDLYLLFQIGREGETAACLMQKFLDRPDLHIRSAVALEHLKNYIYVEAEKQSHVKEVITSAFFGLVFVLNWGVVVLFLAIKMVSGLRRFAEYLGFSKNYFGSYARNGRCPFCGKQIR